MGGVRERGQGRLDYVQVRQHRMILTQSSPNPHLILNPHQILTKSSPSPHLMPTCCSHSYNAMNSTPSCANADYQNGLLRDTWGWSVVFLVLFSCVFCSFYRVCSRSSSRVLLDRGESTEKQEANSSAMSSSVMSPYIVSDCSAIGDMAEQNCNLTGKPPLLVIDGPLLTGCPWLQTAAARPFRQSPITQAITSPTLRRRRSSSPSLPGL